MKKALKKHGFIKTHDLQKGRVKASIRDKVNKSKSRYL